VRKEDCIPLHSLFHSSVSFSSKRIARVCGFEIRLIVLKKPLINVMPIVSPTGIIVRVSWCKAGWVPSFKDCVKDAAGARPSPRSLGAPALRRDQQQATEAEA